MGNARGLIRRYRKKTTEEEREQFREEHPEIDAVLEIKKEIDSLTYTPPTLLKNAEAVLEWIKRQETPRIPSQHSQNEEERKLYYVLKSIRTNLIKPYKEKTTAEEREQFKEEHPEIDDVLKIIKEIKISIATHYLNAQRILEWIKRQEIPRLPSENSQNEEERKLRYNWNNMGTCLINPYKKKTTAEIGRASCRERV